MPSCGAPDRAEAGCSCTSAPCRMPGAGRPFGGRRVGPRLDRCQQEEQEARGGLLADIASALPDDALPSSLPTRPESGFFPPRRRADHGR